MYEIYNHFHERVTKWLYTSLNLRTLSCKVIALLFLDRRPLQSSLQYFDEDKARTASLLLRVDHHDRQARAPPFSWTSSFLSLFYGISYVIYIWFISHTSSPFDLLFHHLNRCPHAYDALEGTSHACSAWNACDAWSPFGVHALHVMHDKHLAHLSFYVWNNICNNNKHENIILKRKGLA